MRAKTVLAYVVCCLAWGSTWAVIKIGLEDLPPLTFAGLRMALALLVLLPFAALALRLRRPSPAEWRGVALAGSLQIGVAYALIFIAGKWIPSSVSAALFATFPIWASVLAHFLLPGEPLTWARGGAALLGMCGVLVIQGLDVGSLSLGSSAVIGSLLALLTPVASALGNVLNKRHLGKVDPVVNLCGQLAVGGAMLLVASLAVEHGVPAHWTWRAAGALAYLAVVGTALAFFALFWMIPHVSVSAVGIIPLIDTTIAVALGAVMLREPLTWRFMAGAALVLLAAALANGVFPAPKPEKATATS